MDINLFGKELRIGKTALIAGAVICVVIIVMAVVGYNISHRGGLIIESGKIEGTNPRDINEKNNGMTTAQNNTAEKNGEEFETISVYVVGCVKNEGIVTIRKGQIIDDAIKAAGGLTDEADMRSINMAYILNENVMLKVLSKKELQGVSDKSVLSGETGRQVSQTSGVKIIKDSGGAIVSAEKESTAKSSKININTATLAELDTLPGIGEKTAQDIIDYREKSGGFKKIEDIMNVTRIGEKRFEQIKELITV